jgi:hypothetical protein
LLPNSRKGTDFCWKMSAWGGRYLISTRSPCAVIRNWWGHRTPGRHRLAIGICFEWGVRHRDALIAPLTGCIRAEIQVSQNWRRISLPATSKLPA